MNRKINPQMAQHHPAAGEYPFRAYPSFSLGLVLYDTHKNFPAVRAVDHPVSFCKLVNMTVINVASEDEKEDEAHSWLKQNGVGARIDLLNPTTAAHTESFARKPEVPLHFGREGWQKMLDNPDIDAIFVIVPTSYQREYVLETLQAGKHVLVNDHRSTSFESFMEQVRAARANKRFIQFSTMFLQHYRVNTFLDCVSYDKFGTIENIDAFLSINYEDAVKAMGIKVDSKLKPGDGCLRRLARHCVLIALLMQQRSEDIKDNRPVSVQVTKAHPPPGALVDDGHRDAMGAKGVVNFSRGNTLTFDVCYNPSTTRQVLEVRSRDRYASMTDFVIPHPDGLATYRIYDKSKNSFTGKFDIIRGEALDVPSGPPQDVMMWRRFADLCRSVEEDGWDGQAASQARVLTRVAVQLKQTLIALEESYSVGCKEISVNLEECYM